MHSSIQLMEVRWSLGWLEPLLLSGTRPPLSSASRELTDAKGAGYLLLKCHTDEHWSTESGFFTTRWSLRKGNWILSKTANYKMIWFFFFSPQCRVACWGDVLHVGKGWIRFLQCWQNKATASGTTGIVLSQTPSEEGIVVDKPEQQFQPHQRQCRLSFAPTLSSRNSL